MSHVGRVRKPQLIIVLIAIVIVGAWAALVPGRGGTDRSDDDRPGLTDGAAATVRLSDGRTRSIPAVDDIRAAARAACSGCTEQATTEEERRLSNQLLASVWQIDEAQALGLRLPATALLADDPSGRAEIDRLLQEGARAGNALLAHDTQEARKVAKVPNQQIERAVEQQKRYTRSRPTRQAYTLRFDPKYEKVFRTYLERTRSLQIAASQAAPTDHEKIYPIRLEDYVKGSGSPVSAAIWKGGRRDQNRIVGPFTEDGKIVYAQYFDEYLPRENEKALRRNVTESLTRDAVDREVARRQKARRARWLARTSCGPTLPAADCRPPA